MPNNKTKHLATNEDSAAAIEHGLIVAPTDRRIFRRVKTEIRGRFLIPPEADARDCVVMDISLGGARVECADAPSVGTKIELGFDGFNQVAGVVVRTTRDGMGISFDCATDTREQIAEKILLYLGGGRRSETRTRRHERLQTPQTWQFTRPDGALVDFNVRDLSLSGASLLTEIRPPVGELLGIGRSCGRVVRHLKHGIAVEFVVHVQ